MLNFATNHLHLGHTLVLMDKWTPEAMLDAIERYRVTSSHMVPTQFNRLLKLPEDVRRRFDVSSLTPRDPQRGAVPDRHQEENARVVGALHLRVLRGLRRRRNAGHAGATGEKSRARSASRGRSPRSGSSTTEARRCRPARSARSGSGWAITASSTTAIREKTGDAWREGFFTVGDAGYLDEDGYLFLGTARADMIISGGVNIYPAEIEAVFVLIPRSPTSRCSASRTTTGAKRSKR